MLRLSKYILLLLTSTLSNNPRDIFIIKIPALFLTMILVYTKRKEGELELVEVEVELV